MWILFSCSSTADFIHHLPQYNRGRGWIKQPLEEQELLIQVAIWFWLLLALYSVIQWSGESGSLSYLQGGRRAISKWKSSHTWGTPGQSVREERNGSSETPETHRDGVFRTGVECKKLIKHVNTPSLKCFTAVLGMMAFLFHIYDSSRTIKRVWLLLEA